ncbi:MAG: dihydroorotate dehydrogenase-like protein [Acidobacteriota bacterium]
MIDLTTRYLGLELKNPLVPSAAPLSEKIDNFRRMEDAGAGAIVNYSLFEEEITRDSFELHHHLTWGTESFAESLTYFPELDDFTFRPLEYCDHIREAKDAVDIPVIASLNGHSLGGWTQYAHLIEEAGADALELNIYHIPTDPQGTGQAIENTYLEILKSVKSVVTIPVAVKLSPFFSSMANIATQLDSAGADGLVLFNRFYQPDIDLETLEVAPNVVLSSSDDLRLPLRWIAILREHVTASLAATSGIHHSEDALKMIMAGADATMVCSTLLKNGIDRLQLILQGMLRWMEEHEYESIAQMKGSMSMQSCPDPTAFERANYIKALRTFPVDAHQVRSVGFHSPTVREEIQAADIMSGEVMTVREEMTVREVANFLTEHEISGAPVVNRNDTAIGVVSCTDITRSGGQEVDISMGRPDPDFYVRGWESDGDDLKGISLENANQPVRGIMTPTVYTVTEDTPISEIAKTMIAGRIHRLLVTRDQRLVGIITTLDLLRVLVI